MTARAVSRHQATRAFIVWLPITVASENPLLVRAEGAQQEPCKVQAATPENDAAETQTRWIVDYDIPEQPSSSRRRFYRRRNKIYFDQHKEIISSTASVLVCKNYALAKSVYDLARRYGKANLYRVFLNASNAQEAFD